MATYLELFDLQTNDGLRQKVAVASAVAAQNELTGTPTQQAAIWAKEVVANPLAAAERIVILILAANASATVAQINAASDASIQTNVNALVPGLIAATVVPA
jgi:hypothetical protein